MCDAYCISTDNFQDMEMTRAKTGTNFNGFQKKALQALDFNIQKALLRYSYSEKFTLKRCWHIYINIEPSSSKMKNKFLKAENKKHGLSFQAVKFP